MPTGQGYIGREPGDSSVTIAKQHFQPTGVQTDFTFSSGYDPGYCDVYLNGSRLVNLRDYTATNGSTVGLITAANSGDIVEIIAQKAFNVSNVNSTSGNFSVGNNLTVDNLSSLVDVNVSGTVTATAFSGDGSALTGVASTDYIITGTAATFNSQVKIYNLNVTGITTSQDIRVGNGLTVVGAAQFDGNVTIGGTLTYEDVTNVDSVGLVTAQTGVRVTAGGLVVTAGVSTLTDDVKVNSTLSANEGLHVTAGVTTIAGNQTVAGTSSFAKKTTVNATLDATEGLHVSAGVATFAGNQTVAGTAAFAQKTTVNATLDATEGLHVSAGVATFADALKVGTGASIYSPASNQLTLGTNSEERIRLDASGRLIVGHNASVDTSSYNSALQILGVNADGSSIVQGRFSADSSSPNLNFSKSRNSTVGSHTIVQDGDQCGGIYFWGSDGSDYEGVAYIAAQVDGTPGSNDTPGRLMFATTSDGAAAATERMRITKTGGVNLVNGELIERCKINTSALNADQVCNLDDGMVHYRTSNLGGSGGTSLILTSSVGLATAMSTGDMMSFTLIHAVNATGNYVDHVNIDHLTVTENWVGGSAPSAGGGSGVDIYTFNIIKKASGTGDTGFTVIGNHIKTS